MNLEKIIFGFFIVLALTLNFDFVFGDISNPKHHSQWVLFTAVVVNLIATGLKLGDRSQIGAVLLSTSLVADLQLIAAAILWTLESFGSETGIDPEVMPGIVSLAAGALLANIISTIMLVADTLMNRQ